ncbi:MAG: cold-shock protein [Acidobacteriota bacterium]
MPTSSDGCGAATPAILTGTVKKKVVDRGFGFIRDDDGNEYFFHLRDLEPGLEFESVSEGTRVTFEIKREPGGGKGPPSGP